MTAGAESSEGLTGSASRTTRSYGGGQEAPAPRGPLRKGLVPHWVGLSAELLGRPRAMAAGDLRTSEQHIYKLSTSQVPSFPA